MQLVATVSRALGLPIDRSTVVVHADINSVSRRSDPWPPATREARAKRVIARANAILRPPIVTVTVKAGDALSEIAAAHGLTLKALLAFPESAKYRGTPALIHHSDCVGRPTCEFGHSRGPDYNSDLQREASDARQATDRPRP